MRHVSSESSAGIEPLGGRSQDSNLGFCDRKFQPFHCSTKGRLPTHNWLLLDVDKLLILSDSKCTLSYPTCIFLLCPLFLLLYVI